MKCPLCNNSKNNKIFKVKEMQQGLREEFEYIECSNCGCLFIKDIPENISKYYDSSYAPHNNRNSIKNKVYDTVYSMYLKDNKLISYVLNDSFSIATNFWKDLITSGVMNMNSSILDVGCGGGAFLNILKKVGFNDLTGVDLFIDEKNMKKGIKVYQSSLEDFKPNRKYDIVMSTHALEHMDNQSENIKCFEKLVVDDGLVIIRIPIKSSAVWEKYGVNWSQIDAPRHFFLHTVESFRILVNNTNLVIENIIFDSDEHIFENCEKYANNISMRDKEWNTFKLDKKTSKELANEVRNLNKKGESDQAIFILKLKK